MKKTFLAFIILFVNTFGFGQNTFNDAKKEYDDGNIQKCIEMFTKLIESKQNLADSYMYRGAANLYLRKIDLGFNDLNASKKIAGSSDKLYYYYAYGYILKDDYKLVSENLEKALKINDKDARCYDLRSCMKTRTGDLEGALQDSNMAIKYETSDELFYSNRAFAKIKLKQYDEALMDLEESIRLKPTAKAYSNKGLAYLLKEMYPVAINNFYKSLDLNPDDGEVYYYRGYCYAYSDKLDQACADFTKSKALNCMLGDAISKELKCN